MSRAAGRHFLQIPGPTNVPDRVLRAIDFPTMDHRGPDFGVLGKGVLEGMKRVFQTAGPVVIYPASGTGAWEAALANTLSPGDAVLMCRTGWFATLWQEMAERLQLKPEFIDTDWRGGPARPAIARAFRKGTGPRINELGGATGRWRWSGGGGARRVVAAPPHRHAEATGRGGGAGGREVQGADPRHFSSSLTAVRVPEGHSADGLRATILARCNM